MILDDIAAKTRIRVENAKKALPFTALRAEAEQMPKEGLPFQAALEKSGISFICEIKKASPSKGLIAPDFPYLQIAREYQAAGARAISVLTEPEFFLGDDRYLTEVTQTVDLPVLRKDFIIDPYQIYEAKRIGASAVLLICALLSEEELAEYLAIAESLGLSALVEAHDETELHTALKANAKIIGVNNRDLRTFTVDVHNSERLRRLVPPEILFVSESGIRNAEDVKRLYDAGVNGVLVGETLMRSADKSAALAELRSLCHE